ncbi:gustatory receptor 68a-like [Anopheles darlingi]|uniref:gustatory receptor 68a-like n=1 Tax=Anopheles darlingi TaxID=43151 RepID=UPI0021005C81|nr:gustatory receptor 68a-like [Anopheles darlingi]
MVFSPAKRLTILKPAITDEQRFWRSFRPLYALSKLFAFWTFTVTVIQDGDRRAVVFRKSRWSVMHFFVMLVLYSTFHLYINSTDAFSAADGRQGGGQAEVNFVSVVIDMYNRYSGLLLFWWLHLMAHVSQPTVIEILRSVMAIDEQIRVRLTVAPDHWRWCRSVCLHVTAIFLGIGLAERFNCIMYMSDFIPVSEYCIFQCLISMLTCSTVEIQYVALVQLIQNRLELINSLLGELTSDHIRMKIINDIKNVYTHLHLLSLNINRAYGAQLIFILMTLFVTLTTLLYYCTMKLLRILLLGRHTPLRDLVTSFEDVLSTLSWICIATIRILRICSVCNRTKNEAQQIGSLIQGLGWKTHCGATKTAVRRLSLQLLQQRIEFSAGGLFPIDHGLMFNIVGSLATFLLILVQFDIAQGGAKWKPVATEPPANTSTAQ